MFTEPVRAWLYRVTLAIIAIAGTYGVVDEAAAPMWVALAAALLGSGVAAANTTTKPQD